MPDIVQDAFHMLHLFFRTAQRHTADIICIINISFLIVQNNIEVLLYSNTLVIGTVFGTNVCHK